MSGLFITFEGIEGCGKSTQAQRLRAHLEERGYKVTLTREPGGTAIGEAIRGILLDPAHAAMTPLTELLLYQAARVQHVEEVIETALGAGAIVVCDRYTDSTLAYQGAGRNLSPALIDAVVTSETLAQRAPDLTLLLDIDVETGLERSRNEQEWDRIEQESIAFHERVRDGFLAIAEREPGRVCVVDARRDAETIAEEIARTVDAKLAAVPSREMTR